MTHPVEIFNNILFVRAGPIVVPWTCGTGKGKTYNLLTWDVMGAFIAAAGIQSEKNVCKINIISKQGDLFCLH